MKYQNEQELQERFTYYWRNPKNGRYYNATLAQDLFGDWILIKAWGGTRAGQIRHHQYESYRAVLKELEKLRKYREKRGYISII